MAHQYISQMDEVVRDAVFGNVGTIIVFRVGAADAEFLEKEFAPTFTANDMVNLPKFHIYLKLMVDGIAGDPFSAVTLPPRPLPQKSYRDSIIKVSRERYAVKREVIEDKIARWSGVIEEERKEEKKNISSEEEKKEVKKYEAECWACGKKTKVSFKPDGVRPVYCKECLKKVRKGLINEDAVIKKHLREKKATAPEEKPISLEEIKNKKPVSFH